MDIGIAITLTALVGVLVVLVFEITSADVAMLGALALVLVAGVLPLEDALIGFANPTLVALGALYVVAAALRNTGALALAGQHLLGSGRVLRRLVLRLVVPVSISSAFLNNTPIVAMGIPAVQTWCERHGVSSTRLLIPLSYASIFGGMCTLMGTSTNLVAHGLLQSHGEAGLGFFELAAVGIPCTLVGWAYLVLVAPRWIRAEQIDEAPPDDVPVAQALEELPGLELRVTEDEGERPAEREAHTVAVLEGSSLEGQTVAQADLPERFNALVEEVRRGGERVDERVEDIVLHAGDTLVLDTGKGFRGAFEGSPEFVVTSRYEQGEEVEAASQTLVQRQQMFGTLFVLLAIVGLATAGVLHIATAALAGALVLVAVGVIGSARAREAVDWQVLLVIGAALGLGRAMEISGAAGLLGDVIVRTSAQFGPYGVLAGVVIGVSVLTNLITNNGAVALFFPIAVSVADSVGIDARPLVIGLTAAGSLALATPLGYQTNLMVYSAGEYTFGDFVRVGVPLQIVLTVVAVAVIPFFWPFTVS